MKPTTFAGKTVLVTGANRGLGQALVNEALRRGAQRVYAGTRQPLAPNDKRVMPLMLEVTDRAQIQAVSERLGLVGLAGREALPAAAARAEVIFGGFDRALFAAAFRNEATDGGAVAS